MPSLYFVHYNFVKIHKTLRVTPAMKAGVTDELHDVEWIIGLIDARQEKPNSPRLTRKERLEFQTETLPRILVGLPDEYKSQMEKNQCTYQR